MTAGSDRRPRDPAGRRQAIVEAAERVIARQGLGGLSHRRVAAEANVPVGSTTYYFNDLDALREAALAHAANASADLLAQWRSDLDKDRDLAATLARLTTVYLADQDRYRTLNELYMAAAHRPELQRLARLWPDVYSRCSNRASVDEPPTRSPCFSTALRCTRLSPVPR